MLRLILGRAGTGKTARIMEEIRMLCEREKNFVILLVPEQYSHEAERELCKVCKDAMSLYAEVLSFTGLYKLISSRLGEGGVFLDKGGRLLAMAKAAEIVGPELRAYRNSAMRAETRLGLLETLTELKRANIGSDELQMACRGAGGSLADKLWDMSLLLDAYNTVIGRGRIDPADRLSRLAEMIRRCDMSEAVVYIDGFVDFTAQENAVIEALAAGGASVTLCLTCDGLYGENVIFESSGRAGRRLMRRAEELGISCGAEYISEKSAKLAPICFLEESLFSYTDESFENAGDSIKLLQAEDMSGECEAAAAQILRLVSETGCRFRDIAVAARGFEDYRQCLEGMFSYYGIPLYMSRKNDLMQKPAAALIDSAFEIITGGWERRDLMAYLRTGLAGLGSEECDFLENYLILWDIKARAWHSGNDWIWPVPGHGRPGAGAGEELAEINRLRRCVSIPLLSFEKRLKTAKRAGELADALCGFFVDIDLARELESRAAKISGAGKGELAAEYAQLWGVIVTALEQFESVLGQEIMTRDEFFSFFRLLLSQYEIGTIPMSLDSVTAGDMDRMRRRNLKHLIVLGTSDDRLPSVSAASGVFSGDEREEMRVLGLELPGTGEESIFRELNLIYNCLTLPGESLTLSYNTAAGGANGSRPSFIMSRIALIFNKAIEKADLTDARAAAPEPALELAASGLLKGGGLEFFEASPEYSQILDSILKCAGIRRGSLSKGAVRALYGESPRLSASRAETLSSCRFAYFLKHGLKAKPRESHGFDAPEAGVFMHYILEGTVARIYGEGGFNKAGAERAAEIARELAGRFVEERFQGAESRGSRFNYLLERLAESACEVVSDMAAELSRSDFEPLGFEIDLESGEDQEQFGQTSFQSVVGKVDRVDGFIKDEILYLRVIDYKTGKKSFSLSEIWHGIGLQMLIYLFSLQRGGKKIYGRETAPAGVLYAPARSVVVKAKTDLSDEEIAREREEALRRSGLILDDPAIIEAMEHGEMKRFLPLPAKRDGEYSREAAASAERLVMLGRHIEKILNRLAQELKNGSIDADPYYSSPTQNACLWCDYKSACHFDEDAEKRRYLPKLSTSEVWERIREGNDG